MSHSTLHKGLVIFANTILKMYFEALTITQSPSLHVHVLFMQWELNLYLLDSPCRQMLPECQMCEA